MRTATWTATRTLTAPDVPQVPRPAGKTGAVPGDRPRRDAQFVPPAAPSSPTPAPTGARARPEPDPSTPESVRSWLVRRRGGDASGRQFPLQVSVALGIVRVRTQI